MAFLVTGGGPHTGYTGQRGELNAFASRQLVDWFGAKLEEKGVRKVVPDGPTLEAAYRRALELSVFARTTEAARRDARQEAQSATVPRNLAAQVRRRLRVDPSLSWDEAITELVTQQQAGSR